MSLRELVVIGGGEHARVVIEAARSSGQFQLLGFADRAACDETVRRMGLPRLGSDEDVAAGSLRAVSFVLGLGTSDASRRREVVAKYGAVGVGFAPVVHARAWVSPTATVGDGAVVLAGAVVNTGARIGNHCIVNSGSIVEHDCELGEFAQVGPGAAVGGGARIGPGAYLGLGCRVRDHRTIGARALVAMGAVVVRDVADDERVAGVPARAWMDRNG